MDVRHLERVATDSEVTVRAGHDVFRAPLYNISAAGCMIGSPGGLVPKGWRIVIEFFEGIDAHARIVWQRGGLLGLEFLRPVEKVLVRHLEAKVENAPCNRYVPRDRFGRGLGALPHFPEWSEQVWPGPKAEPVATLGTREPGEAA